MKLKLKSQVIDFVVDCLQHGRQVFYGIQGRRRDLRECAGLRSLDEGVLISSIFESEDETAFLGFTENDRTEGYDYYVLTS